jgi:hypothetical protein
MAITQQQQAAIIKLTTGMFGAAPGAVYLEELSAYVEAVIAAAPGVDPIRALANALTGTAAFQSSQLYPPGLSDTDFAARLLDNLLGDALTDGAARDWAQSWAQGLLSAGMSRGDVLYFAISIKGSEPFMAFLHVAFLRVLIRAPAKR